MWFPRYRRTLRVSRHSPDVHRDVDDEIEHYLEMRTHELIDGGMEPEEAARQARQAFGDRLQIAAECRRLASRRSRVRQFTDGLTSVAEDLRLGLRQLRQRPGFSALVILTWALCLGANVAIFSVVNGILLRSLPYPASEQLVTLYGSLPGVGVARIDSSLGDWVEIQEGVPALESVTLYTKISHGVGSGSEIRNVFSMEVSPTFLEVLGVRPQLGRDFVERDAQPGAEPTVLISHDLWQERFAGSADVVGQVLELDQRPHTVIGVMPAGFIFDDWEAHLWRPITMPQATLDQLQEIAGFSMIARRRPDVTLAEVRAQLDAVDARWLEAAPADERQRAIEGGFHTEAQPLHEDQVRRVRPSLYLLWAGVSLILLIGCINIATLLLVRNTSRLREIATRCAIGAGRRRVARQLLIETLALAAIGGGLGLLLGGFSLTFLGTFQAYEIPHLAAVRLDGWAMTFSLGLTLLAGVAAGLVPALVIPTRDLHALLRSGGISPAGGRKLSWLRGGLVAAQVALAFVLLIGSGLLFASLQRLRAIDPGLDSEGVLVGATTVPARYREPQQRQPFIDGMLDELRALPGVEEVAVATQLPFSGIEDRTFVFPEASDAAAGDLVAPFVTAVSPGYFDVLRIPILAGRAFSEADSGRINPVAIVDAQLAERHWPAGNAVGQRARLETGAADASEPLWYTVVGIAGNIVQNDLSAPEANGAIYFPVRDQGFSFLRLALRTDVPPRSLASPVRDCLRQLDPQARFFWVQSLAESVNGTLIFRRLPLFLLLAFAAVALFLATLGVYGVLAHTVSLGHREIGLRIALGSTPGAIHGWLLRRGLAVVLFGLLAGALAAALLTQLLRSLLYGVQPNDPAVFLAVALLLGGVAAVACWIPAQRATRIDPVRALRAD